MSGEFGSMDDWMTALENMQEEAESPDGFHTAFEIRESLGKGKDWVSTHLRKLSELGRVEVRHVRRRNISGRISSVPVYRILPAKKKAAARRKKR